MKTKHLFLATVLTCLVGILNSNGQTTESTNSINSGSYLGTSNNHHIEFRRANQHSGLISTHNTFIGLSSGTANPTSASYQLNSAFGIKALKSYNSANSIKGNSAFGYRSLELNLASYNNAFGYDAMKNNVSGSYNIGLGHSALRGGLNAGGQFNVAIGSRTLENHVSGSRNIGIGHRTLEHNSTGSNNIGIGYYAIPNTTGNNNIGFGYFTGIQLTTGTQNVFLGHNTGTYVKTGKNNVIIGGVIGFKNAISTTSATGTDTNNTVLIGDGAGNHRILIHNNGFTGIGLDKYVIPKNRLEIKHGAKNNSGLRFTNLTSASPATFPNNGKVLTVNSNGDVVLTNDAGGSTGNNVNIYNADGTLEADRTVTMNNRRLMFNTAKHGRIYIGNNSNVLDIANFPTTTGNYRLYVEGGILTEKVKVALRSTTNWADYVFENDYELMSLNEVEDFIKKNKHLPGIESAENLAKNGLDLADMQAKQMAKIEELTLHLIEQNKAFEKQKQEIETLKKQVNILLNKSN